MPGEDDWPLDEEDSFKGCDDLPMPVTDHLDAAKAVVTNPFCHADKLFHPIIGPDGTPLYIIFFPGPQFGICTT